MFKTRSDFQGKTFGRLTVLEYAYNDKYGHSMWKCKCECGKEIVVSGIHLKNGHTQSCGCLRNEIATKRFKKHGMTRTRLYQVWADMKARCTYPSVLCFHHYGGRGIKVCDEWENSFEAFYEWAMANGYDPTAERGKCTIDRIDVNGHYCPENCRWVDMKAQRANQRKVEK